MNLLGWFQSERDWPPEWLLAVAILVAVATWPWTWPLTIGWLLVAMPLPWWIARWLLRQWQAHET